MAFKKTANWIPFTKIKPERDPWQQKLLTKLKERNRIDALMQLYTKFLKVSNPLRVMEALQAHASAAVEPASPLHSFVNPQGMDQCTYDRIWEEIYSNINLRQGENTEEEDLSMEGNGTNGPQISPSHCAGEPSRKKKQTGSRALNSWNSQKWKNQDDFYTMGDGYIHVQDQQGAYVMYDRALQDLEELENQLLLLVSRYIEREKTS
uniref:Uncharacterized protein n=1 Tax=Phascolarctos cinereus TaxID=38626 RepID=A0A6P5LZ74_PHACI|nr:putative uncharacterized protein C6orf183 homolog isoform X2 [Phascolarctos cinereus]